MDSEILLLQEIRDSETIELGRLMRNAEAELGRNPSGNGIPISNQSVSSVHGKIFSIGNYWIFQDLGSTNGSWVNGEPAAIGAPRFIRSGDMLQLADTIVQVTELNAAGHAVTVRSQHLPKRSLLVMIGESFIGEFPVPEYGRALLVGGVGADLEIEGAMSNDPGLIIERKGMYTTVSKPGTAVSAMLGGIAINQPVNLRDGDIVSISRYRILFNDPPIVSAGTSSKSMGVAEWDAGAVTRGADGRTSKVDAISGFLDKPAQSSVFGRPLEIEEVAEITNSDTQRIDPNAVPKSLGRDYHPSMRNAGASQVYSTMESFEEKVVWIIGFALFLAFLVLLAIWLFAKHPTAA